MISFILDVDDTKLGSVKQFLASQLVYETDETTGAQKVRPMFTSVEDYFVYMFEEKVAECNRMYPPAVVSELQRQAKQIQDDIVRESTPKGFITIRKKEEETIDGTQV